MLNLWRHIFHFKLYRLVRFCADAVDVCVVEKSSSLRVQACPVRFSMCNLHGLHTKRGVTALVNSVLLQQYVNSNFPLSRSDLEQQHHPDIWIESGAVQFGPVYIEGSLSGHSSSRKNVQYSQHVFLQVSSSFVKYFFEQLYTFL